MANFFDAVGNFISGVGNAISQGFSNLTGGNSSSSSGSSKPSSPTPSPAPSSPTPSSTSSSGGSTSSGSSGSNRGSSAGAQALSQQITNTASSTASSSSSSSSSGSNNGSSGGSKKAQNTPQPSGTTGGSTGGFSESIGNIFDNKSQEVTTSQNTTQNTQNTTNTDAGNSNYNRVVSVVDAIKDNVNDAKNNTEADSGISLGGGSILGDIIENNKPSQTVTDAMRDGNDNSVIVNPQASSLGNIIGGGDSTGSDTQSKKAQNIPEYSTGMENGLTSGGLGVYQDSIGSIFENKQPENTKSSKASSKATSGFGVTPNDVNLGVINAGGLAGVTSGIGNFFESTFGGGNKDTTKTNQKSDGNVQKGVDALYRDEDLVGVHYFDSRDESEAFLRELYPEGDFDWGEPETGWYDPKTGEYLGYLGEEAYPYAIIVPETYDAPVRLEFNTGGAKGGSPVKDTGKTTWADVPSALTRSELRDAGFDYGFSSRNLDTQELMNQSEMRGYDSSWYDGKIGQNIGLYDASKGGYDARTSNISVADVRAGKVSDDVLSSTPSGQAILDATAQIKEKQYTPEDYTEGYMQSLKTGTPVLHYVTPDAKDINAVYTIQDAVEKGMEKKGGNYYYTKSPILNAEFAILDTISDGLGWLGEQKEKSPVVNKVLDYSPYLISPMATFTKFVGDTVTSRVNANQNKEVKAGEATFDFSNFLTPSATADWMLYGIQSLAQAPKSLASLPENYLAAESELGTEKLQSLAVPAAKGLGNMMVNEWAEKPTYAALDLITLGTGALGVGSRAVSGVNKLSNLASTTKIISDRDTGIKAMQVGDKYYAVDPKGTGTAIKMENGEVTKQVRLPHKFARDTRTNIQNLVDDFKTSRKEKQIEKDVRSSGQYGAQYGDLDLTFDGDYKIKNNNKFDFDVKDDIKSNANIITRDIDNLIKADKDRTTGITLFDENKKKNSLALRDKDGLMAYRRRDRDNNALIVRDKDMALAIRDKDRNGATAPRNKDGTPVYRKKDKDGNKILPFLDDLGSLFNGGGEGGLNGGAYWGRGRGRSWKVLNEDITDASQFSGLF